MAVGLRAAVFVHRCCLRVAPRRFRERFGVETEDAFRAMVADAARERGRLAAWRTAIAACIDLLGAGLRERAGQSRHAWLTGTATDVRQALRIYRREPILAAALTVTLALVSGPAVAVYAVLYQLVLAPLPIRDADRLVVISHRTARGSNSYLDPAAVSDYRAVHAFAAVGAIHPYGFSVTVRGQPESVSGFQATGGLLDELGVPFAAGRDMRARELEAVVSRDFAIAHFGGAPHALGQVLVFQRSPLTIVGVLAGDVPLPGPPGGRSIFVPFAVADDPEPLRGTTMATVIARLSQGVDPSTALAETRAVAARVHARFGGIEFTPDFVPLAATTRGGLGTPLVKLSGVMGVVFLIAVASLGSLILARAASRATDVVVRAALGASRWRLIRGWLIDGLVMATPGVVVGGALSQSLLGYARAGLARVVVLPGTGVAIPAVVAIGLLLVTATLFALAPVVCGLLRDASLVVRDAVRSVAGLRRARWQAALVTGQVAVSLALVTAVVWMSASLWRTLSRPVGIEPEGLVTVWVQPQIRRPFAPAEIAPTLQQLRTLDPAMVGVAATSALPGLNADGFGPLRIRPGDPMFTPDDRPRFARFAVSTDYFRVVGIRLLRGRLFTPRDEADPQDVILLSRSFEARWFPEGAVGRVVAFAKGEHREVIGVVEDVLAATLASQGEPQFYVPVTDTQMGAVSRYVMRTTRPAAALQPDIERMLRTRDPGATVTVQSASEAMRVPLASTRLLLNLLASLGGVALLLAVTNTYALSAFAVIQRTREIGIRTALGASSAHTVRLIMTRGVTWVVAGLVLGGAMTFVVAAPLIESQLFQTRVREPRLIGLAWTIVAAAALAASWIPARRAARIDPAITLRAE